MRFPKIPKRMLFKISGAEAMVLLIALDKLKEMEEPYLCWAFGRLDPSFYPLSYKLRSDIMRAISPKTSLAYALRCYSTDLQSRKDLRTHYVKALFEFNGLVFPQ